MDAQVRLRLEDLVIVNKRFSTVFSGLRLNTVHNSAITEPLFFLIRRLVFAAAIIFMQSSPQLASLILIVMSILITIFTVVEKPWKEAELNYLVIANEAFLYSLLLLLLVSNNVQKDSTWDLDTLGVVMIVIVTLCIQVNLAVVMAKAYQHMALLYIRHKNKKAFIEKRRKIVPFVVTPTETGDLESPTIKPTADGGLVVLPEIQEESSIKEQESAKSIKAPAEAKLY